MASSSVDRLPARQADLKHHLDLSQRAESSLGDSLRLLCLCTVTGLRRVSIPNAAHTVIVLM